MILTRTPLRISFCGGGSDIKNYYREHEGAVLSATINKYVFLSLHPYFYGNKYFLKYSKSELVDHLSQIQHPIIRQVFKDFRIGFVDLSSSADVPSGTGLGSSSAFCVGLANLCCAYTNRYMSRENLARYACEVEIDKLKEPIGKQDQYGCAIGGLNFFSFKQDGSVTIERIYMDLEKRSSFGQNLLMFYTGQTRYASAILNEQNKNTKSKQKVKLLHKMVGLAGDLKKELLEGNIDRTGEILHEAWMCKKDLALGISNANIDRCYDLALKAGASGGKLLGAGGGGFLLFYVKKDKQAKVRKALSHLKEMPFRFESQGTVIAHHE